MTLQSQRTTKGQINTRKVISPTDGFELSVIQNLEGIEKIRPVWEQMQSNERYPVPNTDIDRYLAVVKSSEAPVRAYIIPLSMFGVPKAMLIGRIENIQLKYQLGYRIFLRPLEALSEGEDIKTVDYGFGNAEYKQRFGSTCLQEVSVLVSAPRVYPGFVNISRSCFNGLSLLLKYILDRTGWKNWVKG